MTELPISKLLPIIETTLSFENKIFIRFPKRVCKNNSFNEAKQPHLLDFFQSALDKTFIKRQNKIKLNS